MLRKLLIIFVLTLGITILVSAHESLDDEGNPNDPTINYRANACYEGGSMDSKCDTAWEWICGWNLIRFEYNLIPRSDFPYSCRSLLPPEIVIIIFSDQVNNPESEPPSPPNYTFPGGGCERSDLSYVDFNGGNFIPAGTVALYPQNFNVVYCSGTAIALPVSLVYSPEGLEAAEILCRTNGAGGLGSRSTFSGPNVEQCEF